MTVKVGINGFGRIGRNVLRAILESGRTDIEVVAINDLTPVDNSAYLFKYDSVHKVFPGDVSHSSDEIIINGKAIRVTSERDPSQLDWNHVDIALECTGFFKDHDKAQMYLTAGAKRVLVSAPGKGADRTVVYGVNHTDLTADDIIVSNASCTTNCLAPMAKVIHDTFGIEDGLITTVHAYTGSQPTLDRGNKNWERGRAAALSMVPTTTGAAKAVGLVLPELNGKLNGVAIRVPTPNVSCTDFKFNTSKDLSVQAINDAISAAAHGAMKGILGTESLPLVSIDLNHDPRSSIVALEETQVQGRMGRLLSWYDNEWGFSNRMADTAVAMGRLL
ncbi:type I glyceraldehyde-3-phosphate dehydrogenase [Amylibacter sp. IMCC11727]|uniref:type I glyceraldehyde-3-phosphate dehydrogenase n=1 Tax=Amylibacter sp. IMCC11727 TaxID=3039851 RepID=UPI00244E2C4E|nr:type I glyceraldehyde-3-phosphate dehydrogenase [Amylibacter sp. IMCC11727]WGI21629.1 type I glyceraldehyde-3-phosphate dehydrogenase [Amylibacter sp. IMCC11727]